MAVKTKIIDGKKVKQKVMPIPQIANVLTAYGLSLHEKSNPTETDIAAEFKTTQTAEGYNEVFRKALSEIFDEFGLTRVDELTQENIAWYLEKKYLTDGGAESTQKKLRSVLRKFNIIAIHKGWVPKTAEPWVPTGIPGSQLRVTPPNPLNEEEQRKLLSYFRIRDQKFYAMLLIQLGFGPRIRELCSLTTGAVCEDGEKLSLTSADGTKGGRPRAVVTYDEETAKTLLICKQKAEKVHAKRLFATSSGKGTEELLRAYRTAYQTACKELQIPHTKTHDARATFAVNRLKHYLDHDVPSKLALSRVSRDLGHGDSRMSKGLITHYVPAEDNSEDESLMEFLTRWCNEYIKSRQ